MITNYQPLWPINHYDHVFFYDFLWEVQVAAPVGREVTRQLVWQSRDDNRTLGVYWAYVGQAKHVEKHTILEQ